ncbi:MAG: dihydroorotase [Rhodothalassiaceae bacterium]
MTYDLLIRNARLINHMGDGPGDIGIEGERIAAIGDLAQATAAEVIDAEGLTVLPGVIDTQVHFREPGLEHKEDLATGAKAAVLGGVCTVFEMPNTKPLTISAETLADKLDRARTMMCDHAFFMGATRENAHEMAELERLLGCCGVKIFMGASTGDLLVPDDEGVLAVLRAGHRRVALHCEDEFRMRDRTGERIQGNPATHPVWRDEVSALQATERAVRLARQADRRIHVLHVTTAQEMDFLARNKDIASVEVTPQHLTLAAPDCYERLGTYAQMNPPIRAAAHRDGLWRALAQGVVDIIGSDHAPHTKEEKAKPYPDSPSGMPGVQTLLPLLLDHVAAGRLSLARLVDLTSHAANRLFGLRDKGLMAVGYHADLTIVDLKARWTIQGDWLASKCGWSPYEGMELTGKPIGTILRGRRIMWDGDLIGPPQGKPARFWING